jgi:16S rRNA (cytosine967-C5)-methyltransferase
MKRLGILMVDTWSFDLDAPAIENVEKKFDRILLDAPCSGLGVIRRNPDTKWKASKQNLKNYQEKQIRFLTRLAPMVKPSGVLVYAVCSTEPEENEAVIKAFLNKHDTFAIEKDPASFRSNIRSLVSKDGFLVTHPHVNNMDGFFAVRLRRTR